MMAAMISTNNVCAPSRLLPVTVVTIREDIEALDFLFLLILLITFDLNNLDLGSKLLTLPTKVVNRGRFKTEWSSCLLIGSSIWSRRVHRCALRRVARKRTEKSTRRAGSIR